MLNKNSMQCWRFPYAATLRRCMVLAVIGLTATACSSKPGTSDIKPFVMEDLGGCSLWDISNVKKTDGIAQGDRYRVDFSATLTLKASPAKVWEDSKRPETSLDSTPMCNMIFISLIQQPGGSFAIPEPKLTGFTLSKQYEVRGFAVFVKSERGWRLSEEVKGLSFKPIS